MVFWIPVYLYHKPAGAGRCLAGFPHPSMQRRFAFRGPRPRLSHRSRPAVADRHLAGFENEGDIATPFAQGHHFGHRGLVLLYVLVHNLCAFLLVILTSVVCVRSGILSENGHDPWHRNLLVGIMVAWPQCGFRPSHATVGCAGRSRDAWKGGRRRYRQNVAGG
jgi:hypothetical protein